MTDCCEPPAVTTAAETSQPVAAATKAEVVRRQLSLRGLFLCTTYFGISSALAARFGLGIFVLMNGIFLTWLSFRGYLWWMQTSKARPWTYRTAWLLFAVSFGLPAFVSKGCGNATPETTYGWQAALLTVHFSAEVIQESAAELKEPSKIDATKVKNLVMGLFGVVVWNLPNLAMLASPFVLYRQQRGKGAVLSFFFGCAAMCSWMWGIDDSGADLRIGYYVWSIGITTISLARPPGRLALTWLGILGAAVLVFTQLV